MGKIEIDPDEHVAETIRLVFPKFRELGSGRQVFLWLRSADIKMPVVLRNVDVCKLVWKAPAYHSVMQILHNPLYAGAYERKIKDLSALSAARPVIGRGRLLQLAQDLPTVWNAPSTETRTKQRLIHILVQEITSLLGVPISSNNCRVIFPFSAVAPPPPGSG